MQTLIKTPTKTRTIELLFDNWYRVAEKYPLPIEWATDVSLERAKQLSDILIRVAPILLPLWHQHVVDIDAEPQELADWRRHLGRLVANDRVNGNIIIGHIRGNRLSNVGRHLLGVYRQNPMRLVRLYLRVPDVRMRQVNFEQYAVIAFPEVTL